MANNTIFFEHPRTGELKKAPVGFSWTSFFFGSLPLLFRGSYKWFFITLIINIITGGLSSLIFMFLINKIYIKELIEKGFQVKDVELGTIEQLSNKLEIKLPILRQLPFAN